MEASGASGIGNVMRREIPSGLDLDDYRRHILSVLSSVHLAAQSHLDMTKREIITTTRYSPVKIFPVSSCKIAKRNWIRSRIHFNDTAKKLEKRMLTGAPEVHQSLCLKATLNLNRICVFEDKFLSSIDVYRGFAAGERPFFRTYPLNLIRFFDLVKTRRSQSRVFLSKSNSLPTSLFLHNSINSDQNPAHRRIKRLLALL